MFTRFEYVIDIDLNRCLDDIRVENIIFILFQFKEKIPYNRKQMTGGGFEHFLFLSAH